MQPIRIGLIGAGANTRFRHIPGFQQIEGVQLVAVANRSRESGQSVAKDFNIPRVHDHWRDVIADDEVDAVMIGTWPQLHEPATCAALAAGKHVLCEARMAIDTPGARRMLAAAQQSGRVAMLVPSPFGMAGDQTMRRLLGEGYLGHPREIYVRGLAPTQADPQAPLHWRQRSDLSGQNILMLGILNETVQRWFGNTDSVVAQTTLFIDQRPAPDGSRQEPVDIPDSVAVLARMSSGATCVYHHSGHAHHAGMPRIEAYGSAATLVYDLLADQILGARADESELTEIEIPAAERGEWQVESQFIESIRAGRPVTMTCFEDGVKYMQFTQAVRRSADDGRRYALSEF